MFNHIGITADLVDGNDRMSGSNGYTNNVFKSPHGVIGGHVPSRSAIDPQLDIGGLSLMPRDEAGISKASRDSANFTRGPFEPSSIWSKAETNNGWDRANANHFASRPPSPQKQTSLLAPDVMAGVSATPKTAPLPPYAAFNPVITPPQPSAVPLPQRRTSPSPPRFNNDREQDTVNQAEHHLQQLQQLVGPLVNRLQSLDALNAEVARWKGSYDMATAEVTRLQNLVKTHHQSQAGQAEYTAVIIDGESLLFHENYLKGGPQGGQAAARALLQAVAEPSADAISNPDDQRAVMVHVFFNKSSLGNGLIKAGLVSQWSVFDGFWHGFSAQHGLINVIDVGPAKDAIKAKIDEHVKLYLANRQCGKIVVGSNMPLSAFEVSEKITLIQSKPDPTNPQITSYPDLFRTDPLPVIPISFSSIVSSAPQTPQRQEQDPVYPVPGLDHDSRSCSQSVSDDLEVEVFEWESLPKRTETIDEWTQAGAGKKGNKKSASKTTDGTPGQGGQKGSTREKERDNASASSKGTPGSKKDRKIKRGGIKHRKDYGVRDMKPRPCHSHFLSPSGCRQDVCHYGHEYELGDDQLNELATLAKQIPCPFARTKRCHFDNETCIYGHLCPRGSNCTFEECRFDDIDPDHQDWA